MTDTAPVAETRQGAVRGFEKNGLLNFRGIPYAQPPVGPLRFRAPEPALPWNGARDATQYGPNSLQAPLAGDLFPPPAPRPMSEDCLYLNVTTPTLTGSMPVMVWIHGGGFTLGSGADFSGRDLASRGVVVITINYRVGALGFIALPSLADEQGRFTNFGMRDQVAALRWIRENAGAFGGDPANVTIFGESAGGMSVGALLASPEAKGLFARAIAQSGAGHHAIALEQAEVVAGRFCESLGILPEDAGVLRTADAERLLEASVVREREGEQSVRERKPPMLAFNPVIDGQFLCDLPTRAIRNGDGSPVPVLAGSNADEFKLFTPWWSSPELKEAEARALFREQTRDGDRVFETYTAARAGRGEAADPAAVWSAAVTDISYRVPADRLLEATARNGQPAFGYVFDWRSPANGGALGACHSLDVFFMSGTYRMAPGFAGEGPAADALAATMMDAWVAFARTGDPSTPALAWPRFDPAKRNVMLLGERCSVVEGWHEEERRVWDRVIP